MFSSRESIPSLRAGSVLMLGVWTALLVFAGPAVSNSQSGLELWRVRSQNRLTKLAASRSSSRSQKGCGQLCFARIRTPCSTTTGVTPRKLTHGQGYGLSRMQTVLARMKANEGLWQIERVPRFVCSLTRRAVERWPSQNIAMTRHSESRFVISSRRVR